MEIFSRISALSFWEKLVDFHGLLAMFSLILFGAGITLYFASKKDSDLVVWLKNTLLVLFVDLIFLDLAGLLAYIPYRASNGPRTFLKYSESTAWLHSIVFEHKEFLAFAPLIIIFTAYLATNILGKDFNRGKAAALRKSVIFSLVGALVLVLMVAVEAVLVTKTAPLK